MLRPSILDVFRRISSPRPSEPSRRRPVRAPPRGGLSAEPRGPGGSNIRPVGTWRGKGTLCNPLVRTGLAFLTRYEKSRIENGQPPGRQGAAPPPAFQHPERRLRRNCLHTVPRFADTGGPSLHDSARDVRSKPCHRRQATGQGERRQVQLRRPARAAWRFPGLSGLPPCRRLPGLPAMIRFAVRRRSLRMLPHFSSFFTLDATGAT